MNRTWSFLLLTVSGLVLLGAAPSVPEAWDSGTYEANPATTDNVAQGDDHIRDVKARVRERLNVEHHFSNIANGDATDDNGLHRVGSARCFLGTAAPTELCDPGTACTDHDNTGGAGVSLLNAVGTNASEDVGDGRCWIDTDGPDGVAGTADDYTLYTYESNAWQSIVASGAGNNGPNLLYNGDFEANGDTDTTLPFGWTEIDAAGGTSPSYVHATTDNTEGGGLMVTITDGTSTSGGDGVEQVLDAAQTKPSTTYSVVARVKPSAAGHACTLDIQTSGGNTDTGPATSTGNGSFEALGATFTTDATPTTDIEIELISDDTDDICSWDHVGVFELEAPVAQPTRWIHEVVDSTAASADIDDGAIALTTVEPVELPYDSCIIEVTTQYAVYHTMSAGANLKWNLQAQKDVGAWTDIGGFRSRAVSDGSTDNVPYSVVTHGFITKDTATVGAEAGSTYLFQLEYKEDADTNTTVQCNASPFCRMTVDVDCRQ